MTHGLSVAETEIESGASLTKTISEGDVSLFARITGDLNQLHGDETYARATLRFVAPGLIGETTTATVGVVPERNSVWPRNERSNQDGVGVVTGESEGVPRRKGLAP